MRRLIIYTKNEGFVLKQLIAADAEHYFSLVDRCRSHLSQYDDSTAVKYPTKMAVLDSILFPINPRKLRFGVWDHDVFVGMVGLTPLRNGTGEAGGWTGAEFCNMGSTTPALACGLSREFRRNGSTSTPKNIEKSGARKPEQNFSQRRMGKPRLPDTHSLLRPPAQSVGFFCKLKLRFYYKALHRSFLLQ